MVLTQQQQQTGGQDMQHGMVEMQALELKPDSTQGTMPSKPELPTAPENHVNVANTMKKIQDMSTGPKDESSQLFSQITVPIDIDLYQQSKFVVNNMAVGNMVTTHQAKIQKVVHAYTQQFLQKYQKPFQVTKQDDSVAMIKLSKSEQKQLQNIFIFCIMQELAKNTPDNNYVDGIQDFDVTDLTIKLANTGNGNLSLYAEQIAELLLSSFTRPHTMQLVHKIVSTLQQDKETRLQLQQKISQIQNTHHQLIFNHSLQKILILFHQYLMKNDSNVSPVRDRFVTLLNLNIAFLNKASLISENEVNKYKELALVAGTNKFDDILEATHVQMTEELNQLMQHMFNDFMTQQKEAQDVATKESVTAEQVEDQFNKEFEQQREAIVQESQQEKS